MATKNIVSINVIITVKQEVDKNLKLVQNSYKPHLDHHAQLAQILRTDNKFCLQMLSLFSSVGEKTSADGYSLVSTKTWRPYNVVGVKGKTLRNFQGQRYSTITVFQAKFSAELKTQLRQALRNRREGLIWGTAMFPEKQRRRWSRQRQVIGH